jgi:predicted phosphodiesterase
MSKILVLSDLHLEFSGYDQPDEVCHSCAEKHRLGPWNRVLSSFVGNCGVCKAKNVSCYFPRDCGWLSCGWTLQLPDLDDFDIVVLGGDIHLKTRGIRWAAKTFPNKHVIYVAGNHEFYSEHLHKMSIELAQTAQEFPNIHFLDNSSVVIDGVRFLGCTLWTSFQLFGTEMAVVGTCLHKAKNFIADFSSIRFGSTGWMTPSDSVKLHRVSSAFLGDELAKPFNGKTVVVTHHLPSMKLVATEYETDLLSAAFASNLDHLVEQADVWIAGHTHSSFDTMIGKCRCVVNPRGYPQHGGSENPSFNSKLIVEV